MFICGEVPRTFTWFFERDDNTQQKYSVHAVRYQGMSLPQPPLGPSVSVGVSVPAI